MFMTFNKEVWTGELLKQPSGWEGLECYMKSIISSLNIKTDVALEFGIDHGYSLTVLSQLFTKTIGVDSFSGDPHIGHIQDPAFFQGILNRFKDRNVDIFKLDYRDFIKNNNNQYDLIHVDIIHHYAETFECGDWSIQHSNVVLVHDTITFPEMHKVCVDIAKKHGVGYSNILPHNGLGVLYRR
jgi:hypothetical protein